MNEMGNCGWLARFSSLLLAEKLSKTSKATLSGRIASRSLLQLILFLSSVCFAAAQSPTPTPTPTPNPISVENAKTDNLRSDWDINGSGDSSIQGFATDISVNKPDSMGRGGDTIHFKIKTNANYRLDIYRLGYYGGVGARLVAGNVPHSPSPRK
jgi:hypothetical protein